MSSDYVYYGSWEGLIACRRGSLNELSSVEAVVLDCDGTLVDSRRSYQEATYHVVNYFLRLMTGAQMPRGLFKRLYFMLKESGSFTNDKDIAFAMIVVVLASRHVARNNEWAPPEVFNKLSSLITHRVRNAPPNMVAQAVLDAVRSNEEASRLVEHAASSVLGYPGDPPSSNLASLFDSFYYGKTLYNEIYKLDPPVPINPGLINLEEVVVGERVLEILRRRFGRLSLLSSRPRSAITDGLRRLIHNYFNQDLVILLDDQKSLGRYKPDESLLLEVCDRMGVDRLLYVGDSPEDLEMSVRARRRGVRVVFVASYRYSINPTASWGYFIKSGADILVPSVNSLPLLLV